MTEKDFDNFAKTIEDFHNLIETCRKLYPIYYAYVNEQDKRTQDLLHSIEFKKVPKTSKVITELEKVRNNRRNAKDLAEFMKIITDFTDENKQSMNKITQLLGIIRKKQQQFKTREYKIKVPKDIIP